MENIQAIRESIESLSTDEKIDDGTYLMLMNHLKKVYETVERGVARVENEEEKFLVLDGVPVYDPQHIIPEDFYRYDICDGNDDDKLYCWSVFRSIFNISYKVACEMLSKHNAKEFMCAMRDCVERKHDPTNDISQYTTHSSYLDMTSIPHGSGSYRSYVYRLIMSLRTRRPEQWELLWNDLDKREIFLQHPDVRRCVLNDCLEMKYVVVGRLLKNFLSGKDYEDAKNENPDTDNITIARVAEEFGFPFINKWKPNHRTKMMVPRTDAFMKKHHRVHINFHASFQLPTMEFWTDKIQLGRSPICPPIYRMLLLFIIKDYLFVPDMERVIKLSSDFDRLFASVPILSVSGITAATRAMSREYWSSNGDFTITYMDSLNDVRNA